MCDVCGKKPASQIIGHSIYSLCVCDDCLVKIMKELKKYDNDFSKIKQIIKDIQ